MANASQAISGGGELVQGKTLYYCLKKISLHFIFGETLFRVLAEMCFFSFFLFGNKAGDLAEIFG
jgi:hypothetical protein